MYIFCYSIVCPCQSFVRHIVFRSLFNLYMIHVLSLVLYSYTTLMSHQYIKSLFFSQHLYILAIIEFTNCQLFFQLSVVYICMSYHLTYPLHASQLIMSIYVCYQVIIGETMTSLMRNAKCVGLKNVQATYKYPKQYVYMCSYINGSRSKYAFTLHLKDLRSIHVHVHFVNSICLVVMCQH